MQKYIFLTCILLSALNGVFLNLNTENDQENTHCRAKNKKNTFYTQYSKMADAALEKEQVITQCQETEQQQIHMCKQSVNYQTRQEGILPVQIRSPLARAMFEKIKEDERNRNDRHIYWYRVITSRLPLNYQELFIQFDQDEGTDLFLQHCQEKSDNIFSQIFHSIARPLLGFFMAQTSINGLLNRGSMFIFSKNQFEKLMGFSAYHKTENLLDLGAGDGKVTQKMSPYFNNTYATEMSNTMVRRLQNQGFKILGVSDWFKSGLTFDLVTCLNLLDRCDKPLTLLSQIKAVLRPHTGRLLVALVIPFKPFVEFGSRNNEPSEYIHLKWTNFEDQVEQFFKIFDQAGFEVERFTRLPYLCEGDLKHSFYVLTDALFVLKAKDL